MNAAAGEGFQTVNLGSQIQGEAETGAEMAEKLISASQSNQGLQMPLCLIGGGETTVRLKGGGLGGRNLELALAAVRPLAGMRNLCLVTLSTDGEDGPTYSREQSLPASLGKRNGESFRASGLPCKK